MVHVCSYLGLEIAIQMAIIVYLYFVVLHFSTLFLFVELYVLYPNGSSLIMLCLHCLVISMFQFCTCPLDGFVHNVSCLNNRSYLPAYLNVFCSLSQNKYNYSLLTKICSVCNYGI